MEILSLPVCPQFRAIQLQLWIIIALLAAHLASTHGLYRLYCDWRARRAADSRWKAMQRAGRK